MSGGVKLLMSLMLGWVMFWVGAALGGSQWQYAVLAVPVGGALLMMLTYWWGKTEGQDNARH